VQLGKFHLAFAELLQGAEQLLVLLLELFEEASGARCPRQFARDAGHLLGSKGGPFASGSNFSMAIMEPPLSKGSTLESIHQPPGPDNPLMSCHHQRLLAFGAHPRVFDSGSSIADANQQA